MRSLGLLGRGRKGEGKVLQMANPLSLRGALERMYVPWVLMLTKYPKMDILYLCCESQVRE